MKRRWNRIAIRVMSMTLLAAGLTGGIYLGSSQRAAQAEETQLRMTAQAQVDEVTILRQRQSDHAAARAVRRAAEGEAASKASVEVKKAAGKARELEKTVVAQKKAEEEKKKAEEEAKATGTVPFTGDIPSSCSEFSGNRAIGCALMVEQFPVSEFGCLNSLWTKESGWNHHAENKSSGAYGIPQAYPGSKMSSAGSDWETNPATQIKWGLGYISDRYGTPCDAWSTSESTGSY